MIKRKTIDFAIRTDSPENFVRLGNLIPNEVIIKFFIENMPDKLKVLLDNISNQTTDILIRRYFYNNKLKTLSTYITNLIDEYSLQGVNTLGGVIYTLSYEGYDNIYNYIYSVYRDKWTKLLATLNFEYNPIKPYDMTTKEKIGEKQGGTTSNSSSTNDSSSDTNTSKVILDETEDSIYGFNSLEAVPSNKSKNSSENSENNESEYQSSSNNTITHGRTNDINRELSRSGNIGNITQQELIKQERDVSQYIIWDTIYDDLNRVFTRSKYIY